MAFTGGQGDLTYRIQSAVNVPDGVTYSLSGSMLSVTVPGTVTDGQANDMVIMVEAMDESTPAADDVAHINVRMNVAPTISVPTTLALVVGTQGVASPVPDGAMDPDYYLESTNDADNTVVCGMLNQCLVKPTVTDANLQDMHHTLKWYPETHDSFTVAANADDTGVIVTGVKPLATAVTLYVVGGRPRRIAGG